MINYEKKMKRKKIFCAFILKLYKCLIKFDGTLTFDFNENLSNLSNIQFNYGRKNLLDISELNDE